MGYKWWIITAVCLFSIGFGIGLAMPDRLSNLLSEELAALSKLSTILSPFKISTAIFILLKNISALLLSFLFSPILCLLPILALIFNGLLLAFVSAIAVQKESLGFILAGLLPHGILELSAFIMGEAAALSFGTTVIAAVFKKESRGHLLPSLKQNSRYLLIAFALLVPAAIIETYVTPLLLR
jgi:stage II sporulation protein M